MNNSAKYLYGFVDQLLDPREDKNLGPIGLDGRDLRLKRYGRITLAVSDLAETLFTGLPKETLLKYLTQHQTAIEIIMAQSQVLPFKFGTFVENPEDIPGLLDQGESQIKDAFETLKGRIELDVVVLFHDPDQVIKEIGASEEIQKFQQSLALGPEQEGIDARIALGKRVKSGLDQLRDHYAGRVLDHLEKAAEKYKIHDIRDDAMIANLAFLLEKKNQPLFEEKIEALDQIFEGKVDFRIIGPLPYYSFLTFMIACPDFGQIDNARKCLKLSQDAQKSEIKAAYRNLSTELHPDRHPGDPGIQAQFEAVNQAYKIIMAYCQDSHCFFSEEAVKDRMRIQPVEIDKIVMP